MARVKGAMRTRARHKKILKLAKGYRGAKSKLYKTANQAVMKSLSYAYRDRKVRKAIKRTGEGSGKKRSRLRPRKEKGFVA